MVEQSLPDALRGIREGEEFEVRGRHETVGKENIEADDGSPVGLINQHDRDRRRLARLAQGKNLEQLVECAEAAGEDHQGVGAHRQMHLPHREIVKPEGQLRCGPAVRLLFLRQGDVEADRRSPRLGGAAVGRRHDARAPAGGDDIVAGSAACPDRSALA